MTIDPNNLAGTATLTFHDEFNMLSLWNGSSGTWATNLWWGWDNGSTVGSNGSGDQQWYIDANYAPTASVRPWTVSSGILSITGAKADPSIRPYINDYEYTSGLINSYYSFNQLYGYFEMSAQLPKGQGLWPAFWLLPTSLTWPPEVDIMEVLGHDMTSLWTVVHTTQTGTHTSVNEKNPVSDMSIGFHTYGLNWQADYLTWYFDGVEVFKFATPTDLHSPMYIVANLTVGSSWPGFVDSTTPLPASFKIDYIRAYQDLGTSLPPPPPPLPPETMKGTTSADTLHGTAGNDTINGLGGADRLYGGEGGADIINGGVGNDYLYGENGADTLTGGLGRDNFVFNNAFDGSIDRITDFSHRPDTITLENGVFTALSFTGQLPSAAFYIGSAAHDATDLIIYDTSTGALKYDSDGTGPAAPVQFAVLGTGIGVAANDFYVI